MVRINAYERSTVAALIYAENFTIGKNEYLGCRCKHDN